MTIDVMMRPNAGWDKVSRKDIKGFPFLFFFFFLLLFSSSGGFWNDVDEMIDDSIHSRFV
eukprot:scaffold5221_cov88-Cylindrotheca_fusiformis.AAC.2